jgi:hypothetical protein
MLLIIEDCLRNIKDPNEVNIFIKAAVKMLMEFFNKINTSITSVDKITTIIKIIFFSLFENKNILNITFDNLRLSLKKIKSSFYKTKDKFNFEENLIDNNSKNDSYSNNNIQESILLQKTIIEMREILECYFYFILRFTNDVNNGKKIWLILENYIGKKFNSEKITNRIIDLIILFTLGKCRYLKNCLDRNDNINKNRELAVSAILEYVSDKFLNSKILIPIENEKEKSEYIENHSITLFTEIICNNSDLLPFSYISSESFIQVN